MYKGACGAMLNDVVCSYSTSVTPNAETIKGGNVSPDTVAFPDLGIAENYGVSGMGGGGGGWHTQAGSGKGGDGLGGFACIWWEDTD